MKNPLELYNQAVTLLEQAASFILQGNTHTAQRIINSLDIETYEFCLDMYEQKQKNITRYRSRFVFASLEFDPELKTSEEQIEKYRTSYLAYKEAEPIPSHINIHEVRYDIVQIADGVRLRVSANQGTAFIDPRQTLLFAS